jgi:allantoin racemase
MWPQWYHLYTKLFNQYRLWDRVASLRSIDTRPDLKDLLAGKEEVIFEALERECLEAIQADGADVIILGSTTMHQSHAYLSSRLPVPVINPGLAAYKMAEVVLEMGLSHSKIAFPTPEMPRDQAVLAT